MTGGVAALGPPEADRCSALFRTEVLNGLCMTPRRLPAARFRDARSERLFERLRNLPDYYPARAEAELLHAHAPEIARLLGAGVLLVELGTGRPGKAWPLLEHLTNCAGMVPVHPPQASYEASPTEFAHLHPQIPLLPICGNVEQALELPLPKRAPRRIAAFLTDGVIGDVEPDEAVLLLRRLKRIVRPGGALLLGFDVKKDAAILERPYDDAGGVGAGLNRHILLRINDELGGRFHLPSFLHRVYYNEPFSRIEWHLRSTKDQIVSVARRAFSFRCGESIHTRNFYKYQPDDVAQLAARSGFRLICQWQDPERLFSLAFLSALATHSV